MTLLILYLLIGMLYTTIQILILICDNFRLKELSVKGMVQLTLLWPLFLCHWLVKGLFK